MDSLQTILEIVKTLGGAGSIVALFILWQAGLLGKKGINGKSKVEEKLDLIKDNHMEHIQAGINDILVEQTKVTQILNEFKEYGIPIRTKSRGER